MGCNYRLFNNNPYTTFYLRYKQLIVHDADVRKCIGRFNPRKIDRKSFQKKYEHKLKIILYEKTKELA